MTKDLHEPIMPDNATVNGDYYYIVDGKVSMPCFVGTVKGLKKHLKAEKIQRCDMEGRGLRKPRR